MILEAHINIFLGCILSTFLEPGYDLIKCSGIIIARCYTNRACPEKNGKINSSVHLIQFYFLFSWIITGKATISEFFRIRNCPSVIDPLSITSILPTSNVGAQISNLQAVFLGCSLDGYRVTLIWE